MKNIQQIHKPRREHKHNIKESHQTTTGKTKKGGGETKKYKTNWENKVKMAINTYLSIIPLKVDRLNAPIKRQSGRCDLKN